VKTVKVAVQCLRLTKHGWAARGDCGHLIGVTEKQATKIQKVWRKNAERITKIRCGGCEGQPPRLWLIASEEVEWARVIPVLYVDVRRDPDFTDCQPGLDQPNRYLT
jgi:hypothetical protein